MADLDINNTTTTDIADSETTFSVDPVNTNEPSGKGETKWSFPDAAIYRDYMNTIPELNRSLWGLTSWIGGKGWEAIPATEIELRRMVGDGKDNAQTIFENLMTSKKLMGDAFAEIVTKDGRIINLKPVSTELMAVVYKDGMILRYEITNGDKTIKRRPEQILHMRNQKLGSEMHGHSVVETVKWALDARNEAMQDHRVVIHRNRVPVRIIEFDSNDIVKRNKLKSEYKEAILNGEVLLVPMGTVKITESSITIQDPIVWIQYLENFIYITIGVPRVIVGGADQTTQADNKIGYLTFEQVYATEQRKFELDLLNQLGWKLTFNRPISLKDKVQEDEAANTSQQGFQNNDTQAGVGE